MAIVPEDDQGFGATSAPPAALVAFPVSEFPFFLDGVSPLTSDQARCLIRLGLRHRILRRVERSELSERTV